VIQLPLEAREGLMRVWVEILKERHPGVAWVPGERKPLAEEAGKSNGSEEEMLLAA
jgi:hypothetical protein